MFVHICPSAHAIQTRRMSKHGLVQSPPQQKNTTEQQSTDFKVLVENTALVLKENMRKTLKNASPLL